MEPQARYTVVGASVVVLLVVIVAAVGWLLASGNGKDVHHYTLVFTHQSLEGLEANSEVRQSEFGVLLLTLHARGYAWRFEPVGGGGGEDGGSGSCH